MFGVRADGFVALAISNIGSPAVSVCFKAQKRDTAWD